MDKDNNLALISLYNFSSTIDEKINLKKTILVGINPEIQEFPNNKRPGESVKNILVAHPRDCFIDGVDLEKYCVQQHLKLMDGN